jgi:hypothetical protein
MMGHSISTWKCPEHSSEMVAVSRTTYREIAFSGVPICPECGTGMGFVSEIWIPDRRERKHDG